VQEKPPMREARGWKTLLFSGAVANELNRITRTKDVQENSLEAGTQSSPEFLVSSRFHLDFEVA